MRNGLSYHRVLQRAWASTRVEVLTFQFVDLTIVPIGSLSPVMPNRALIRTISAQASLLSRALLRWNAPDMPALVKFVTSTPEGRRNSQQSCRKRLNSYWPWTGMNGQALSLRKFAIRAFDEARRRLL
jgi:hypothetical protein